MAVEIFSSRILGIAMDELPKRSLGLEVIGLDVCWGNWNVTLPTGQVTIKATYAITMAVRAMEPSGAVTLGAEPLTAAFVLSNIYPSEPEIRGGIAANCDGFRAYIRGGKAT